MVSDQVNEKNVALIIKGGKLTAKMLAKAMKAFLQGSQKVGKKIATPQNMNGKGKQTVKQLTRQGVGVSNIEITDSNIKSFERVARKYGVDFALKKDPSEGKYMVFFKARDTDALNAAFSEFTATTLSRKKEKPSIMQALSHFKEIIKNLSTDKVKNRDKGGA